MIFLSVIIPCFNEEKRLNDGYLHLFNYLRKQKYAWELIFIDDGSKDKTYERLKDLSKAEERVTTITYKTNKGKGFAIKKGVETAQGKLILFSDLDHAVPINSLENFLPNFKKGSKVVIGSRRVEGAKLIKRQHPVREFLGKGFTMLVRILIDWKIKDATCGFKAFEKNTAKKLFSKISIFNWAFDAELLYLCKIYKINVIQAPVSWSDVTGSKVSLQKDIISSLLGLVKIRLNDLQGKYR